MSSFFFFNDTATTEIYTLSLHDALPISRFERRRAMAAVNSRKHVLTVLAASISMRAANTVRSEEHTSELQSQSNLVCRLLLEKKKIRTRITRNSASHILTITQLSPHPLI